MLSPMDADIDACLKMASKMLIQRGQRKPRMTLAKESKRDNKRKPQLFTQAQQFRVQHPAAVKSFYFRGGDKDHEQ